MKVRELIVQLLDQPLDGDVRLFVDDTDGTEYEIDSMDEGMRDDPDAVVLLLAEPV